jgi:hypothetical protein
VAIDPYVSHQMRELTESASANEGKHMSDLIIIGYDDHDTAKRAYAQVIELQKDHIVELNGLAVVTVDTEGQSHVDTPG